MILQYSNFRIRIEYCTHELLEFAFENIRYFLIIGPDKTYRNNWYLSMVTVLRVINKVSPAAVGQWRWRRAAQLDIARSMGEKCKNAGALRLRCMLKNPSWLKGSQETATTACFIIVFSFRHIKPQKVFKKETEYHKLVEVRQRQSFRSNAVVFGFTAEAYMITCDFCL